MHHYLKKSFNGHSGGHADVQTTDKSLIITLLRDLFETQFLYKHKLINRGHELFFKISLIPMTLWIKWQKLIICRGIRILVGYNSTCVRYTWSIRAPLRTHEMHLSPGTKVQFPTNIL